MLTCRLGGGRGVKIETPGYYARRMCVGGINTLARVHVCVCVCARAVLVAIIIGFYGHPRTINRLLASCTTHRNRGDVLLPRCSFTSSFYSFLQRDNGIVNHLSTGSTPLGSSAPLHSTPTLNSTWMFVSEVCVIN